MRDLHIEVMKVLTVNKACKNSKLSKSIGNFYCDLEKNLNLQN